MCNAVLLLWAPHLSSAKTQRQHPHITFAITLTFAFPFHIPIHTPPLQIDFCTAAAAASHYFLICFSRFAFACAVRSLFSSFCCYLPPFVPCILGTVDVYAPLDFCFLLSLAQAALCSQLLNCVCE